MAETDWKPGDVAMVATRFTQERLAVRGGWRDDSRQQNDRWWFPDTQTWSSGVTARRLLVIDPEDRATLARLYLAIYDAFDNERPGQVCDEDLGSMPPIFEPDGLGAVVRDRQDRTFVRTERHGGVASWIESKAPENADPRWVWSAIDAVEVLSEGWTA